VVEVYKDGYWQPVDGMRITPDYNLENVRGEGRPYETYALLFEPVSAASVRVVDTPGGTAAFTSLARLAVYHRDCASLTPDALPVVPLPDVFHLISPQMMWDLSENLVKLTGLAIKFPLMKQYLDQEGYIQYFNCIDQNYRGEPDLWFLVGETLGWSVWKSKSATREASKPQPTQPYVQMRFHKTLAHAVAPIVVEGQVLGEMTTYAVILKDSFDLTWHQPATWVMHASPTTGRADAGAAGRSTWHGTGRCI
jgi:hypothetical protein